MLEKSAILTFPKHLIDQPFVSKLIKEREIEINILQAHITPQEDGQLFAIFKGEAADVEGALAYLRARDVRVTLPIQNLVWNEEMCVHCGGCTGQCNPGALFISPLTFEVHYDGTRCIACKLCISACSYGAIESISDHLRRKGEL